MRRALSPSLCAFVLVASAVLVLSAQTAWAQRGFGGRGARGSGSLTGALRQSEVRDELGVTDEQMEQVDELARDSQGNIREYLDRLRNASGDERDAIRAEMQEAFARRREEADQRLAEILTPQQMTRLQQLTLQRQGVRALTDETVATSLEVTEEQQQQIQALLEQRDDARRELGFTASDEERENFQRQWDSRVLAVLTPEQRNAWQERLGPPLGPPNVARSAPATGASSSATTATPPAQPAEFETEVPEGADVVASFAAEGAPANGASRQIPDGDEERSLSFNFRYAPWDMVLMKFAEVAGLTLDLTDVPKGTFSYYDDTRRYTITEALDVLNGYLQPRGYVLLRRDNFLVSWNYDLNPAIPANLIPTVSAQELPDRGRSEIMTVVFPLQVEDVAGVAEEIEKLKSPLGTVAGIEPTRSLVVTDVGANLMKISQALEGIVDDLEQIVPKVYQLEHIFVDDAEYLIRQLLGLEVSGVASSTTSNSAANQDPRFERFARFRGGNFRPGQRPERTPTARTTASQARVTSDPRTNLLLVAATLSEHRIVEETLSAIDVETVSPLASDRPYGALGDKQVKVIPLSSMDPSSATATLQAMFLKEGDEAPTIQPNLAGRQIMVRGTEAQIYQIEQLLADLGEDGTGNRSLQNRGPVRTFNLGGRDPQELLPILERMWEARRGTSLRVVNPEQRSRQPFDVRPPTQTQQPEPERPPAEPENVETQSTGDDRVQIDSRPEVEFLAVSVQSEETEGAATDDPPIEPRRPRRERPQRPYAPAPQESPSAIGNRPSPLVQSAGGDLVIMGNEDDLDELEAMLERAMGALPPRTTWSIFPLRSADAVEAAAMLEQLFPDASVAQTSTSSGSLFGGLTGGISSFSNSVADMTGLSTLGVGPQTLRIIPDMRLNALFVTGPAYRVQEVEQMLEVLDASGLTESLRDRSPQMIPVLYADIDEVYEIVKSVYEPELTPPQQRNNDRNNPFAAFVGGGSRSRGGNNGRGGAPEETEPQVTLGIDRSTSQLIVSADDGTFREIQALVKSIDRSAQEARRTFRVVALENTNAATVQGSVSSLIPKVTVSTSGSRPSTSSSSGSSNSPSSGDLQRRMEFFRRMREGGGFPFGGGGPGGRGFGGPGGGRGSGGRGSGGDRGRGGR